MKPLNSKTLNNLKIIDLVLMLPRQKIRLEHKGKECFISLDQLTTVFFQAGYNTAFRKLKDR